MSETKSAYILCLEQSAQPESVTSPWISNTHRDVISHVYHKLGCMRLEKGNRTGLMSRTLNNNFTEHEINACWAQKILEESSE